MSTGGLNQPEGSPCSVNYIPWYLVTYDIVSTDNSWSLLNVNWSHYRFRTAKSGRALLLATRDSASADRLEISLDIGGRVRVAIAMGITEKKVKLSVARWQNLIPPFPWIAPGWRAWGRNPNKGRDQILQRSIGEP